MKPWRRVSKAIEEDMQPRLPFADDHAWLRSASAIKEMQRLMPPLPFPEEKTIDTKRCCGILHVSPHVLRRLSVTPLKHGSAETCLRAYNTMRFAPIRIHYDSLVRFLDQLRERHGIVDRCAAPIRGRRRDDDLLPFPWADTMTVLDAAGVLSVDVTKVRLRIDAGKFEAYQLTRVSDWRISRSSFAKYITGFEHKQSAERPYSPKRAAFRATLP